MNEEEHQEELKNEDLGDVIRKLNNSETGIDTVMEIYGKASELSDIESRQMWHIMIRMSIRRKVPKDYYPNWPESQRCAMFISSCVAKYYSDRAKTSVCKKFEDEGLTEEDLGKVCEYITNVAPVKIHFPAKKVIPGLLEDPYYRNKYEIGTSTIYPVEESVEKFDEYKVDEKRKEEGIFGGAYRRAKNDERLKYGVLDFANKLEYTDNTYGDAYIQLKNHVKEKCTITAFDSYIIMDSSKYTHLSTFDHTYHLIDHFCDFAMDELKCDIDVIDNKREYGLGFVDYIEVQVHGTISLETDVEYIGLDKKLEGELDGELEEIKKRYGVEHKWIEYK